MANCSLSRVKIPASARVAPEAFQAAYNYPELIPVAAARNEASSEELSKEAATFATSHEADDIGIAPMDPLYVFEGYTIDEPWVIILALAHNYDRLKQVPSDETNGVGVCDVGDQYARGTRASYALDELDPPAGIQCHAVSRTWGQRIASHPTCDCLGFGRTWQTRLAD